MYQCRVKPALSSGNVLATFWALSGGGLGVVPSLSGFSQKPPTSIVSLPWVAKPPWPASMPWIARPRGETTTRGACLDGAGELCWRHGHDLPMVHTCPLDRHEVSGPHDRRLGELHVMLNLTVSWWELILRSAIVYAVLLLMLRLSGKRQIGQLAPFDSCSCSSFRTPCSTR